MYRDFGVVQEVEEGIVELLFSAAFPSGNVSPFIVITRDLGLWISKYPQHPMTILDATPAFGRAWGPRPVWNSQLEREIKRKLLAAGWPREQIVEQYQKGGPTSVIPDFGLVDALGNLTAIVEVKGSSSLLGEPVTQAVAVAKTLGSRFAIVTNGERVLIHDAQSDMTLSRDKLPAPSEVGLEVEPLDVKEYTQDEGLVRIEAILERSEILEQLHRATARTLIFDHTIPWGNKPDVPALLFETGTSEAGIDTVVGICTASMCFSASYGETRTKLTRDFGITGVIELPSDLLKPLANVKSSL